MIPRDTEHFWEWLVFHYALMCAFIWVTSSLVR